MSSTRDVVGIRAVESARQEGHERDKERQRYREKVVEHRQQTADSEDSMIARTAGI